MTAPAPRIRPATDADATALGRMFLHQARHLAALRATAADAAAIAAEAVGAMAATRAAIGRRGGVLLVAEAGPDGRPSGMLTLLRGTAGALADPLAAARATRTLDPAAGAAATLLSLWVEPERRRAGLGRALIEAAADLARGHGIGGLDAAFDDEVPGLAAFYRSLGFAVDG